MRAVAKTNIVICSLLLGASGASAHHSFAMFDALKEMTIEGTVSAFTWQNPHVWIDVMVGEGGTAKKWGVESQSTGILFRQGWGPNSVKVGERIKLQIHPMKNGNPGGQLMKVTLADGRELLTSMARRGGEAAPNNPAP